MYILICKKAKKAKKGQKRPKRPLKAATRFVILIYEWP
jgi:hypothetical protein